MIDWYRKIVTVVIHTEYESGGDQPLQLHRVEKRPLSVARSELAERILNIRKAMRETGDFGVRRLGKMSYAFFCTGIEHRVPWDGTHEVRS